MIFEIFSGPPASGKWSPTNNTSPSNMVQVTGYVYDGGGVGHSNLTQETQYPGGSQAPRVTQNYYDWRDRLVEYKKGVQANENDGTHRPIFYDNLGEVTTGQRYDGDGLTITGSGTCSKIGHDFAEPHPDELSPNCSGS